MGPLVLLALALFAFVSADVCKYTDHVGGKTVDLTPLTRASDQPNWEIAGSGIANSTAYVYFLNPCAPLTKIGSSPLTQALLDNCTRNSSIDASACQMPVEYEPYFPKFLGVPSSLVVEDNFYELWMDGGVGNTAKCHVNLPRQTVIRFVCGSAIGAPVFLEETDSCTYIFEWRTIYVCSNTDMPKSTTKCDVISNSFQQYDLSPLFRTKENWKIVSPQKDGTAYTFEINVCGALVNKSLSGDCAMSGVGLCQSKPNQSSFAPKSLGAPTPPRFTDSDDLVVDFLIGTHCGDGSPRNATIVFVCSEKAGLGKPVFQSEPSHCVYMFVWETAVACPIRPSLGSNCQVINPDTGNSISLSSIPKLHLRVPVANASFDVSICHPITCGSDKTAGVCQTMGGTSLNIGSANNAPLYLDGSLTLVYAKGAPCPNPEVRAFYETNIEFFCNVDADEPIISLEESDICFRSFYVSSSSLCEVPDVDCTIADDETGNEYDLSPLTRVSGNWAVGGFNHSKYILNICRPVFQTPDAVKTNCPSSAAACYVNASNSASVAIGYPNSISFDDGHPVLTMTAGVCQSSKDARVTTTINFICNKDSLGEPKFLWHSNCEYTFEWQTSAACPLQEDDGVDCSVTDADSGLTFDLTSLMRDTDYVVNAPGYTYNVHLCGPSTLGCTGASEIDNKAGQVSTANNFVYSLGQASTELEYTKGSVVLNYENGRPCHNGQHNRTAMIIFLCSYLNGTQGPVFSQEQDDCTYVFEWKTSLVCPPEPDPIDCTVDDDDGNHFDLTDLMNDRSNYQVDADDTDGDLYYQINICRPIVPTPHCEQQAASCSLGVVGGKTVTENLGLPSSPQFDPESGNIFIEYTNGSTKCAAGGSWTTHIDFVCERDSTEIDDGPWFVGRDEDECTVNFQWNTPLACADDVEETTTCVISDPDTGSEFDLTPLTRSSGNEYSVTARSGADLYTYYINVCGETQKCPGSGVCQTKPSNANFNVGLGQASSSVLTSDNGKLSLVYSGGDKCHNNITRASVINFECNLLAGDGTPVFDFEAGNCTYVFKWETQRVCRQPIFDCKTTFNNGQKLAFYDLSPLMKTTGNWLVDASRDKKTASFELNLCRPIVPSLSTHHCSNFSASCETGNDVTNPDLGYPDDLQVDPATETPFLLYKTNIPCPQNKSAMISTYIEFSCAKDAKGNVQAGILGSPKYVLTTGSCQNYIRWTTSYACPISTVSGQDCAVTVPQSGEKVSLFSLAALGDVTIPVGKYLYTLSICENNVNSKCSNSGACQTLADGSSFAKSMGVASTNVSYSDGNIKVRYGGGDICASVNASRVTEIIFKCDPNAGLGTPTFVSEIRTCVYQFMWLTSVVCQKNKPTECIAIDSVTQDTYDLTTLSSDVQNWVASAQTLDGNGIFTTSSNTYILNVCRNLVNDTKYPECSLDSASCLSKKGGSPHRVGMSLGKPSSPKAKNGVVTLQYDHGEPCDKKSGFNQSTLITFTCSKQKGVIGHPVFTGEDNTCVHSFLWTTSAACPEDWDFSTPAPAQPTPVPIHNLGIGNCSVIDSVTGTKMPLTDLSSYVLTTADQKYKVAVCSTVPCGSSNLASACMDSTSFGRFANPPTFDSDGISLVYTDGSSCAANPDVAYSTTILFTCNPSINDAPTLILRDADDCSLTFEAPTAVVCEEPPEIECYVKDALGNQYDFSDLVRNGDDPNWVVTSSVGETFEINICDTLNGLEKSDHCFGASACMRVESDQNNDKESYPLGNAAGAPKVYGGGFIHLNYASPSTLPSEFNPCAGDAVPSIQIAFFCRRGDEGEPVFVSKSVNCVYNFNWYTSAACPTEIIKGGNCQVTDSNDVDYDLTPLSAVDFAAIDPLTKNSYRVAVCHSLHNSPCSTDGSTNGACVIPSSDDDPTPVGDFNKDLIFSQGTLSLVYSSNVPCPTYSDANYKTIIEFQCDPEEGHGSAKFEEVNDHCETTITIYTKFACASKEVDCATFDPVSGAEFDLSPLMRDDANWDVLGATKDSAIILNVCRSLAGANVSSCETDSGVCQINPLKKTTYNLGHVASPIVEQGILKIVYDNGDTIGCPDGRKTTITFYCDKSTTETFPLGQPQFAGELTPCEYSINWKSRAACPVSGTVSTTCIATDSMSGYSYDLSSLQAKTVSDTRGFQYVVNPCGAIAEGCNGDYTAGICQTTETGTYSLGARQFMEFDEGLTVVYSKGTPCHANEFTRSAVITFVCSFDEDSLFFVEEEGDCTYDFVWKTSLACTSRQDVQCVAFDMGTATLFDLSALAVEAGSVNIKDRDDTYHINVCMPALGSGCDPNAAICVTHQDGSVTNLGRYDSALLHPISSSAVTLTYSKGDTCSQGSGGMQTIITFVCDAHAFHEQPKFLSIDACVYKFQWATCHACAAGCGGSTTGFPPPKPYNPSGTTPKHTTASDSSSTTTAPSNNVVVSNSGGAGRVLLLLIIIGLVLAILYVVLKNPSRRERIFSMFDKNTVPPRFQYKKLNTADQDDDDDDDVLSESEDTDDEESATGRKREVLVALSRK